MLILNLRRGFETLKTKDSESVKTFTKHLLQLVNQIRVLGEEFMENDFSLKQRHKGEL